MAKSSMSEDIELQPDAWACLERAAKVLEKSPPRHRVKKRASGKTNVRSKSRKKKVSG